jgi:hypothetical protein
LQLFTARSMVEVKRRMRKLGPGAYQSYHRFLFRMNLDQGVRDLLSEPTLMGTCWLSTFHIRSLGHQHCGHAQVSARLRPVSLEVQFPIASRRQAPSMETNSIPILPFHHPHYLGLRSDWTFFKRYVVRESTSMFERTSPNSPPIFFSSLDMVVGNGLARSPIR